MTDGAVASSSWAECQQPLFIVCSLKSLTALGCGWQGCTNVLWGVARCEAKKPQIVVGRGQVFKDMVEAVMRRAEVIIAGRGLPVNYSMLLWALGSINFHPGREFLRKMLDVIASRQLLDDFDAQVRNWACLGLPPTTSPCPWALHCAPYPGCAAAHSLVLFSAF